MAQTILQIPIEKELKESAENLFKDLGLDINNAVSIYFRQCLYEGGMPFRIKRSRNVYDYSAMKTFLELRDIAEKNGLTDMNLDEINAEIALARQERKKLKEG